MPTLLTVVKLGGSLSSSEQLAAWLEALAGCGGRAVLVPGGGPFANTIRATQSKLRFTDAAAHEMSLLAMEQYGRALASIREGFQIADSARSIELALASGKVPIWAPASMVLDAEDIPANWTVTSDSLAVWLSAQINAARLLLVKRGKIAMERVQVTDLAALGIVDAAFPAFLTRRPIDTAVVSAEQPAKTGIAIRDRLPCGVPVALPRGDWSGLHV